MKKCVLLTSMGWVSEPLQCGGEPVSEPGVKKCVLLTSMGWVSEPLQYVWVGGSRSLCGG